MDPALPMPLLIVIQIVTFFLWQLSIRPFCLRHRKGYTPGANIGVTIWVDWQDATELSKTLGDRRMLMWCRTFLALHLMFVAIVFIWLARTCLA